MRKGVLFIGLVSVALWAGQAAAQSGFNGTWRWNADKTRPSRDPVALEFKDNTYRCTPCNGFSVLADGADHPDGTNPQFDAASARLSPDGTLQIARKKAGKVGREIRITPSGDGQALTVEHTEHNESTTGPARITTRMKRHGAVSSGLHPINGEWLIERWDAGSENVTTVTIDVTNERMKMTSPTGEGYEAKFDGREYPVSATKGLGSVRVKRVSPTLLEETNLRAGKVSSVARLELSPDGRTMTITITEPTGRTPTVAIYEKQ